jgi:hypothetical protein
VDLTSNGLGHPVLPQEEPSENYLLARVSDFIDATTSKIGFYIETYFLIYCEAVCVFVLDTFLHKFSSVDFPI